MPEPLQDADSAPVPVRVAGLTEGPGSPDVVETLAVKGAQTIASFLGQKVTELAKAEGGKALSWVTSQVLQAIGIDAADDDRQRIQLTLDAIAHTQQEVLERLEGIIKELQFEHLITRGFESVERISSRQQQMRQLLDAPASERKNEAEALKAAILDGNNGAAVDLKTVHDVLVGNDPFNPDGSGLLDLFMERWKKKYSASELLPDVPLSAYYDRSYEYLNGLFITQYMGIDQLAAARVANGEYSLLHSELDGIVKRLSQQQQVVDKWIPAWTADWTKKFFDRRWYVISADDLRGHAKHQVLYGSPATDYLLLSRTVQFRDRHPTNGDEEWQFVPTGTSDTFHLVQRSRPACISANDDGAPLRSLVVGSNGNPKSLSLRFVMSSRGKLAIAVTNIEPGYLAWINPDNTCSVGSEQQAAEVTVEPAGH